MKEILWSCVGLGLGAVLTAIYLKLRHHQSLMQVRHNAELEKRQLTDQLQHLEAQKADLDAVTKQFSDSFKALSQDALKSNNELFLDLARGELEKQRLVAKSQQEKGHGAFRELIEPLKEHLKMVDSRQQKLGQSIAEMTSGFREQIGHMIQANHQLKKETGNLSKALRTPEVRGRWGEMTLKRVAELAGMVEHCDFSEQLSRSTETSTLRPDMIVHLPNERQIVVDAKTPLKAYLDAMECSDEAQKENALAAHARQLKTHMNQLAEKSYWAQFTPSPEFVVLFVPGEHFFSAALRQMPGLIDEGIRQGVILATPTTLVSLLKSVGYGWKQEAVTQNARQINSLARDLYNRLTKMASHFGKLEKNLKGSVASYNSLVGTLESRVLPSARRFKDLGVDGTQEIPDLQLIDNSPRQLQAEEFSGNPLSIEEEASKESA